MIERLRAMLRALMARWNHASGDNTDTTPDPIPDPVDVPVEPPEPPTPPEYVPARLGQLHIFCEAFDGRRSDSQIVKLGWPADKVWVHVWDSPTAWSSYGRRVLTIKNPNGNGSNRWDHPIADWRGALDGLCRVAKANGCSAVSIDLENWLISTGPALIQHLYGAAHAVGLPLINVPRLGLDHLLVGREDNWAWTRPPPRANMTPQAVCEHLNRFTDLDVQWDYGTRWQVFGEARDYLTGLGYRVPIVPMMDGAGRDGKQRLSDTDAAAMVGPLWAAFGSLGILNPHALGPKFIGALRDIR